MIVKRTAEEENRLFRDILDKHEKFTDADLQLLRELTGEFHRQGYGWLKGRMEVEVIAAIEAFDRSSAALVDTTNRLTQRILWLTVVTVIVAVIALFK